MRESNWASLWLPVNWVTQSVIVSDHQTNSHSYVSALAPFSSGAVPLRPLKAKKLTGQGFKPISSLNTAAITTEGEKTPCLILYLREGLFMLAAHLGFFSRGEGRVTVKNSHQLTCHFSDILVKLCFVRSRLSLGLLHCLSKTSVHLVSTVKPNFKSAFIEIHTKCVFSWTCWSVIRDRPVPQVWIIACTT